MEVFCYLTPQRIVVTIAVYLVSLALCRLLLHPLSTFPGPKLAALTRYYEAYFDLFHSGKYTWKIQEMHKKYGPIIRISPYELHVSDPTLFKELYNNNGRWNKYDWAYDAFSVKLSTFSTVDHHVHRRRRAPLGIFFSKTNVTSKLDIVQNRVKQLCDRVSECSEKNEGVVNIGFALSALTRDVAIEFILGRRYNILDEKDFGAAVTNVFQSGGATWRITKHIRWFGPSLESLPVSLLEKLGNEGTRGFFGFLRDCMWHSRNIVASLSTASVGDDMLRHTIVHEIINSSLPQEEKTLARIDDEVITITGAVSETTAQVLRLILYHVYSDLEVLTRLRAELTAVIDPVTKINTLDLVTLERLPYFTAVLMEGLRLSPGIATRMARIAPDRDLLLGQWRIPAGTPVGMTTLLMHMGEELYPEPHRYNPDRWMSIDIRKKAHTTFAPFSKGTRICLGMHLAWAELYLVVASLVTRFNLELVGAGLKDVWPVSDQFIIGTRDQSGIWASVTQMGDA